MANDFKVDGHLEDPASGNYWGFDLIEGSLAGSDTGSVDLRPFSSKVHNQRTTSSCVANAVAKALEIKERRAKALAGEALSHTDISRLHLYYLSREMHQAQGKDGGTYISVCCDVLQRFGICSESAWPFDTNKILVPPSWKAMRKAYSKKLGLSGYYRIKASGSDRAAACIKALRAGHPVVYGTTVNSTWFKYRSGSILQPVTFSSGRHATCLVGWDDSRGVFIGENSWGASWGDAGCYLMSPDVIEDGDSKDFWVIRGHWEESPSP